METIRKICDLKKQFVDALCAEAGRGVHMLDTKEAGDVADMIKDLSEAEKNCYEAKYYKTVVMAMEDYGEHEERRGYNHRRYANGEYAPAGRGHVSGYHHMPEQWNDIYLTEMERKGYTPSRHGQDYDGYRNALRHYSESHSVEHKREMDMHANRHIDGAITSMKDIWSHADPELKKRMKSDLTALLSEMSM